MRARVLLAILVLVCAVGVIWFQVTRPAQATADANVFVPSPELYLDFSPSFRTSIADVYYLSLVQYFGEHVEGDREFPALPEMVDLVTTLSPHFKKAYIFGAFALHEAGRPDLSYKVLERGFKNNPDDYRFPAYIGFFAYQYGAGETKDAVAAAWYAEAAKIPGCPDYVSRLAATLFGKGGELEKSVAMWGQVYLAGDKFSRQRAVNELNEVLPEEKEARMKALAPLVETMPEDQLNSLIASLFEGYE